MVLVLFVFFVFAVLSHFAKTENMDCPVHPVNSEVHRTSWGTTTIYAVKVCVTINWPIQTCSRAKQSFVSLNIKYSSGTERLRTNFTPAEVKGHFCEVYDPCKIAKALKGKDLTKVETSASAEVFAFGEGSGQQGQSLSISIQSGAVRMRLHGESRRVLDHEFMSIVCMFPKCTINSKGYGGDAKYYFKEAKEKQAPLCVKKGASTFSVTVFDCGLECDDTYNAAAADKEVSPRPRTPIKTTAPTNGDKVTPKTDGKGTPTADGKGTPTADGKRTPTADGKRTPTADGKGTPTADGKGTPTADGKGTPTAPADGKGTLTAPADGKGTLTALTDGGKAASETQPSVEKAAAATTTQASNAFFHLRTGMILTVVVLALLV